MLSKIQAEAAAWVARLQSECRTPDDIRAWEGWLDETPVHREAFDVATAAWEAGGAVGHLEFEAAMPNADRRLVLASASALSLTAAGLGGWWLLSQPRRYETAIGEQRRIDLADGSSVMLDTNSALTVAMSRQRRALALISGRAHFDVAFDPLRPFVVRAADQQVVALGTAFDVACRDETVSVVLVNGRVMVAPAHSGAKEVARYMAPGDHVVVSHGQVVLQDGQDLTRLTAWQSGRLIFESEPLSTAVAEMNQYTTRRIAVSPSLANVRIDGEYDVHSPDAFARSVAILIRCDVETDGDRITLIDAAAAAPSSA